MPREGCRFLSSVHMGLAWAAKAFSSLFWDGLGLRSVNGQNPETLARSSPAATTVGFFLYKIFFFCLLFFVRKKKDIPPIVWVKLSSVMEAKVGRDGMAGTGVVGS
ncbi:hypothetical protein LX36DRAFT_223712 [Colletotrichum falcatum]|nr:hypothetical protein LX36DRAFT_223712 [Colletotrichum falcatum]